MNTPTPHTPHTTHSTNPTPLHTTAPFNLFFGGSFDPPHLGHTQLPTQAAQKLEAKLNLPKHSCHIIYVPAARSPHKSAAPTADHHRLEMLNLALKDLHQPHTIWTQELNNAPLNPAKPSYWADTWSAAQQLLPNATNMFLIGADQALAMHRWHNYDQFWQDALVILRDDSNTTDTLIEALKAQSLWTTADLAHWKANTITLPLLPHSSTTIRKQLAQLNHHQNDPQKNTRIEALDPAVQSYIQRHKLYT